MKKDVLMYFDLITSIKTTKDVDDLSLEIDILASTLFKSEKISLDKAIAAVSFSTGKKIMEIFEKNNLDINDRQETSDFFETLKDLIKKFKVIKLVMAFDPSLETIENIHEFVSENIGIGYVLDIEKDESVLAGAIVMFNGKYKDLTLRKSLEETFKLNRSVILNSIQGLSPKNRDAETSSA